jgi:hypothetical protein
MRRARGVFSSFAGHQSLYMRGYIAKPIGAPWHYSTGLPPPGRISPCQNTDRGQPSESYSERPLGYGCGVSGANITRRSLAQSRSFGGVRMPQATCCVSAHAAPVAAGRVRPSSVPAGQAITSASIRSRRNRRQMRNDEPVAGTRIRD